MCYNAAMAIERVVRKKGEEIERKPLQPGDKEQFYPRGFWRRAGYHLFKDHGSETGFIEVLSDNQIAITRQKIVDSLFSIGISEVSTEIVTGQEINAKNIKTNRMGIPPKVVSFKWVEGDQQNRK
jgi:hypothetical protein